jgi:hypothetical protein
MPEPACQAVRLLLLETLAEMLQWAGTTEIRLADLMRQ